MKSEVYTQPVVPAVPKQRVVLDLSVEEFSMLANLVHSYLGGDTSLRLGIENGILVAAERLHPEHYTKFNQARRLPKNGIGWNSENVERVFA